MTDEVGYGRPPKHSQFKTGESGNKSGRPKIGPSFQHDLITVLQSNLEITKAGVRSMASHQAVLADVVIKKAIAGDMRAFNALSKCLNLDEQVDDSEQVFDLDDLDAMQDFVNTERRRQSSPEVSTPQITEQTPQENSND